MEFSKNKDDGSLSLNGITYLHFKDTSNNTYNDIPIYEWKSTEPIKIPTLGKDLHFEAEKKTLDGIKISEPGRLNEIGKVEKGTMNLTTDIALTGTFLPFGSHQDWGIVMNYRKKWVLL